MFVNYIPADWLDSASQAFCAGLLILLKDSPTVAYLVYREKILPIGKWVNAIAKARNEFAESLNLPTRNYQMNWRDFTAPASGK
jgi:hypothetical protein